MRARSRLGGEFPIIYVNGLNDVGIQAPSAMRANPNFYGRAIPFDEGAWAMTRPLSPVGGANAYGLAMGPSGANMEARAPWMSPRPLAIGGRFPQQGPYPIPARPERALPPARDFPEGGSNSWGMRALHPLYAQWNRPLAHGNAGPNARPFGWRPVKR